MAASIYHTILVLIIFCATSTRAASVSSDGLLASFSVYETLSPTVSRVTRETNSIRLHFSAFNRSFHAHLSPSKDVFYPGVHFMYLGEDVEPQVFYKGQLKGEAHSSVKGHIINGVFNGIIISQGVEYHVEQSEKYFSSKQPFHSIIYRAKDVYEPNTSVNFEARSQSMKKLREIQATAKQFDNEFANKEYLQKRSVTSNRNKFCPMLIAADHLFLENIGLGSVSDAMSELIIIMSQVQDIFQATDFDDDGESDGIKPVIARIEIMDLNTTGYLFSSPNISVNDYLDLWSQIDHTEFCLSMLFTHRIFAGDVQGLSWVAQPPGGNRGGICEEMVSLSIGPRFLNTAIVSAATLSGEQAPRSSVVLRATHQLGHNFGSLHDPDTTECSPGAAEGGNYVMFSQSTEGNQTNNRLFSPCSRRMILPVLQSSRSSCFSDISEFCGNGILEENEECDCGSVCDSDLCCNANCTLTAGSVCSSNQECCNDNCQFKGADVPCREETECLHSANCTGYSGICSVAEVKNGTNNLCSEGRNICIDGVCTSSICASNNLTDCQCTAVKSEQCHICCVFNGVCTSTFNISTLQGQFKQSGGSCNNFTGFCDSNQTCVSLGTNKPLEDLLDLFNTTAQPPNTNGTSDTVPTTMGQTSGTSDTVPTTMGQTSGTSNTVPTTMGQTSGTSDRVPTTIASSSSGTTINDNTSGTAALNSISVHTFFLCIAIYYSIIFLVSSQ